MPPRARARYHVPQRRDWICHHKPNIYTHITHILVAHPYKRITIDIYGVAAIRRALISTTTTTPTRLAIR